MQSKHAWDSVLQKTTWNGVKNLIKTTMKKGSISLLNDKGGVLVYEAIKDNVVVRYAEIDGIIKIADAWIKTR